ncbi:uncharacterized protein UBRO_20569 [Ustilago bromivora]|uniref:Uncharacterized protein n=1 Tax=Ustilago bromivora TaxID=307758 RepID=A0A1K0H432_9BASI|nr:uncharacterized protein UBRO_20569 [Ustilago bromivora]
MMCMHHLPQTFWPFAATATTFMKNLLLNIKNQIPYHISYDKDPWKSFSMLHTFGCLAWVNIPKAKCKKLDELAIPTIFVRYDKEHKGWRFLAPSHNPPIFWSNSACFLQDKSWNDRTDTILIQDTDALHYNDLADVEDLGYDTIDEHDEELQQPLDNIYCPPPEPDTAFEGDSSPLDPQAPLSNTKTMRWTIATHEMFPWLHPTTLAELLQIYPRMFPLAAEMHRFQEKLQHCGKLADIGPIPKYDASAHALLVINLKPLVREALTRPHQIHWWEAIKAEMDGLESMHIWETVDKPKDMNLVDSKLVLQVKTNANHVPYKFKARFCAHSFSQKEGIEFDEIFTLVVPRDTIQTILMIVARSDWEIDSIDITQAYLNADLHHDIYLKLLEGTEVPDGKVYKLIKSLYGLKQSGREWHKELDAHLQRLGFFPLPDAPCVYLKGAGESQVIIAVYVVKGSCCIGDAELMLKMKAMWLDAFACRDGSGDGGNDGGNLLSTCMCS